MTWKRTLNLIWLTTIRNVRTAIMASNENVFIPKFQIFISKMIKVIKFVSKKINVAIMW